MGKIRIQRGDVYLADLSPVIGSEQGGVRPVLIIQNDVGNRYNDDRSCHYGPADEKHLTDAC